MKKRKTPFNLFILLILVLATACSQKEIPGPSKVETAPKSGSQESPIPASSPSTTKVAGLQAPIIISPKNNSTIDINSAESIKFSWQAVSGAQSYTVVLTFLSDAGEKVVNSWTTKDTSITFAQFETIDLGSFSWSVTAQAQSDQGTTKSASSKARFKIVKMGNLGMPKLNL